MTPRRRIFHKHSRSRVNITLLVLATILAAVAACAPEPAQWSPAQNVKRNEVRWVTFEHEVTFGGTGAALGRTQQTRLQQFLARHDAGYGDHITVGAMGAGDTDESAALREETVVEALRGAGFRARRLPDVPSLDAWDGSVTVVLGRFVVLPPDCPDWSKRADSDPDNRRSSNFGCASATNLGLMLADPGDLVRGRAPGPADGAAGARLYRAYREGEQQQAPSLTPLVIQSGVGGSGGAQ